MNNSTKNWNESHNGGIAYLRTTDIVFLISLLGVCAILTMLVIGQRKEREDYVPEPPCRDDQTVPELPLFLRWIDEDSENIHDNWTSEEGIR